MTVYLRLGVFLVGFFLCTWLNCCKISQFLEDYYLALLQCALLYGKQLLAQYKSCSGLAKVPPGNSRLQSKWPLQELLLLESVLLRNNAVYCRKEVLLTSLLDFQEPDSLRAWFWTVNGSSQFQFRPWSCCRKPLTHIKCLLHQQHRMMALSPDKVQQLELCLCPLTLQSDSPGKVKCTVHWGGSHRGSLSVQDLSSGQCQSYNSTL